MEKKELRKYIRESKKRFSPEQLAIMNKNVITALENRLIKENGINTILLYHSLHDEVCTHELIDHLYSTGKRVLLPTVIGEELELHEYCGNNCYQTGEQFNIQESNGPIFQDYKNINIAIIPGMAFTKDGYRLGRGKGYYDRLLPKIDCPLIGLAFPFQIVDTIPVEEHDVRMNEVLF